MNTATLHDKKGHVACPASFEFLDPLATGFKVHYTTEKALKKHHGVCRKCAAKFKKHNLGMLRGAVETPAVFEHHHDLTLDEDHAGFVRLGEMGQITDFPYEDVDTALGLIKAASPDARQEAAEVLHRVFQWCYPQNGKTSLRTAAARLAILVSGLRPDTLDKSLEQMAHELGRTKAALSKTNVKTEQFFGIHFARSRSAAARAAMAAARTRRRK